MQKYKVMHYCIICNGLTDECDEVSIARLYDKNNKLLVICEMHHVCMDDNDIVLEALQEAAESAMLSLEADNDDEC